MSKRSSRSQRANVSGGLWRLLPAHIPLRERRRPPRPDRLRQHPIADEVAPKDGLLSVAKAIRDVCKTDAHPDGKLTAVVATHRHKDHISGFATNPSGQGLGRRDRHR